MRPAIVQLNPLLARERYFETLFDRKDSLVDGTPVPSPFGVWGAAGTAAGEEEDHQW